MVSGGRGGTGAAAPSGGMPAAAGSPSAGGPPVGGISAGSPAAGAGGGVPSRPQPGEVPTFTQLYDTYFRPLCGVACHTSPPGFLNFSTRGMAYQALVGQPASPEHMCGASGLLLVVPSQPDKSLLVQKLLSPPPCGATMPFGGSLPEAEQAEIRAWIAAGALDN